MRPTLLITGANGFIGKALCSKALGEGFPVFTLTRKPFFLSSVSGNTVLQDFSKSLLVRPVFQKVEVVIHLAARVHVMNERSGDALSEYRKINVENTLALAKTAVAAGVKRFIYLSSIKVNGEETYLGKPFTAEDKPAPLDAYGISKMEAEEALISLGGLTGMEIVIIRPPLVYGPGVGANFASMMRWVSRGIPLPLGLLRNQRSLVNIHNLTSLILTCAQHHNAANQVFLVSDDEDVSIPMLLQKLASALKTSIYLIPVPVFLIWAGATLIGRRSIAHRICGSLQLNIGKTKKLLDWSPAISLDSGLEEIANWYQKND